MKKHRMPTFLLALLLMLSLIAMPVSAADEGDNVTQTDGYSLTVEFNTKEYGVIEGSEISIYRALDKYGELTGDFTAYADEIELGDLTDAQTVRELADTLSVYAARDLDPAATAATDVNGQVVFEGLERGVYLLVGSTVTIDKHIFTPMASLVELPLIDDDNEIIADVFVNVKYEFETIPDDIEVSVKKVWADNNYPNRPNSVTIELLRDGAVYDEVTLDEKCEWTYTWTDLDPFSTWQVAEKDIPEGYTVSITLNETTFVVTNTFSYDTEDKDDSPPSGGSGTGDSNPPPTEPSLPQTGQLWWPVPILLIAGAFILLAGIVSSNLSYDEKA